MAENLKLVVAIAPLFYELGGSRERGEKFEMRESDIPRHVEHKLVVELGASTVAVDGGKTVVNDGSLDSLRKSWTVSTAPVDYLKRFPNGPNATLALQILELEEEEKEKIAASTGEPDSPPVSTSSIPKE